VHFFMHLLDGDHSVGERARMIAGNLARRTRGDGCCGHYGDPGC
jgi:hypothetical protein